MNAQVSGVGGPGLRSWQAVPPVAVAILLLYLIFEYLRMHEIWPILGELKVQTATLGVLILVVIGQMAKEGVRLARQSWLFLGFLGLTVFTIIPAANWFYAYRFSYGLSLTLGGYFAITHILRNERNVKRVLALLVGIHIYLAMKGIVGYSHSEFDQYGYASTGRVGGSFLGDENDVALAMIIIFPFAMYLFRQTRSLPGRVLWGVGGVSILLAIIFTFSRGGFIGLTAMALYWVTTTQNRGKAIGILVLAAALLIAVSPRQYWARIETIRDLDSGTALERRHSWTAAGRMFRDSPIWGVGGNNFGVLVPEYTIGLPTDRRPHQWWGRATHSMYFQLLAEFGLLGALLIGWVVVLNFRDLRQVTSLHRKGGCPASVGQLAESLRLSWAGFLISAAFLSVLGYPHLYYLTALTVVVRGLAVAESAATAIEPVGTLEWAG